MTVFDEAIPLIVAILCVLGGITIAQPVACGLTGCCPDYDCVEKMESYLDYDAIESGESPCFNVRVCELADGKEVAITNKRNGAITYFKVKPDASYAVIPLWESRF